jgi:hypothetical protein
MFRHPLRLALLIAALALLLVPSAAPAKHSRLATCGVERIQNLTVEQRTALQAACATKRSKVAEARTAWRAAVKQYREQTGPARAALRAAVAAAPAGRSGERRAAIRAAKRQYRAATVSQRRDLRSAGRAFKQAVRAAKREYRAERRRILGR